MSANIPKRDELKRSADFRLALRQFHAATDRVVRGAGLTSRQYLLLLIIESTPSRDTMRVGDLAAALDLVPSTITELLDRAESAGLLERFDSQQDGRVTLVRSTPEGRRRLRKAFSELATERRTLAETAQTLLGE